MADGDIFVYLGGDQVVPDEITHAIIDPSVKTVRRRAFANRRRLVSVIFHDGVEIVEEEAFCNCRSLRRGIKLLGVKEIGDGAFLDCFALPGVEFGDKLETIGVEAFCGCHLLRSIKMPSVRIVRHQAFGHCRRLIEAEFGVNLETVGLNSFYNCSKLQRIAIPLNYDFFPRDPIENRYNQFDECTNLTEVDLLERVHKTISSLLLETWKDEMSEAIKRINRQLPSSRRFEKANVIRLWIRSVINRLNHYKAKHNRLLKKHMTLLELAVWKAKLDERDDDSTQKVQATKRAKIDEDSIRKEKRITSGADIIIKNVLPFLKLG